MLAAPRISSVVPIDPLGLSPSFFGTHVFGPTGNGPAGPVVPFMPWPELPIRSMRMAGRFEWRRIETARSVYDWTTVDALVGAFRNHGCDLNWNIRKVPTWAGGGASFLNPPSDMTYLTEMVTAFCQRYCSPPTPQIAAFQIWNEINLYKATGFDDTTVVTIAQTVYNAVKAVNPAITVIGPSTATHTAVGLGPSDMDGYLTAGLAAYCDVQSFHDYTHPDSGTVTAETAIGIVEAYKAVYATHGVTQQLWVTEGGWVQQSDLPADADQAAYVAKWLLLHAAAGVQRVFWYAWDANTSYNISPPPDAAVAALWTGFGLRASGIAYGEAQKWMVGARIGSYLTVGTIWSIPITRPLLSYSALAIWDTAGSTYSVPAQYIQYRDVAGVLHSVVAGSVGLTSSPILLETGTP